jgi:hypothetical protein
VRTSANRASNGGPMGTTTGHLKVVKDLGFAPSEAELQREILEALGERSKLVRASMTAVLLGLLALLFAGNAIAVTLGVATPAWAARITLAGALLLVAGEMALIAYGLRHPSSPKIPGAHAQGVEQHEARLTG